MAGSSREPVFVVNDRWVLFPAENATAGIYAIYEPFQIAQKKQEQTHSTLNREVCGAESSGQGEGEGTKVRAFVGSGDDEVDGLRPEEERHWGDNINAKCRLDGKANVKDQ